MLAITTLSHLSEEKKHLADIKDVSLTDKLGVNILIPTGDLASLWYHWPSS